MPLYEYKCANCGELVDKRHGFDEPMTDRCEHCGGELRRSFNVAGIVFKGSGFYVTDSRKSGSSSSSGASSNASSEKKSDGDSKSDAKTETKTETKTEAKTETAA